MTDMPTLLAKIYNNELEPVVLRLQSVAPCSTQLVKRIEALCARIDTLPAGAAIQAEGAPVRRPRYLISGWACRHRLLADGRRQIFDLVLPGEGVGVCLRPYPMALASTSALTSVRLVDAAPLLQPETLIACPELEPALQMQAAADERWMLNQILRLGRLTALERLGHLLLDIAGRLDVTGGSDRLPLPLTQETLADLTGLSVVHVNRTLQELRRQKLVMVERGWMRLPNRAALADLANYGPPASHGSD